jgi:hypothetical protein
MHASTTTSPSRDRRAKRINSRPARLHITPVLHVDRVHLGEVIHVGQEDIDLDDLVDIGTGFLENVAQVLDALVLFGTRTLN